MLYLQYQKETDMTDKEIFTEVFNRTTKGTSITMTGTLVYHNGECMFNTSGYNLGYNLHRLTNLLEKVGQFR